MKYYLHIALVALLFFPHYLFGQTSDKTTHSTLEVAVLLFQDISPEKSSMDFLSEQIPAMIESRLAREKTIRIQERRKLNEILHEHELAQYGVLNAEAQTKSELEMARLIRADYMILGNFKVDNKSKAVDVFFKLVHADTGVVGFTAQLKSAGEMTLCKDIESASGMAAAEILGGRSAEITVESSPGNSRVYLNGNYIGETPVVSYPVVAGNYELRLDKKNYISQKNNVEIKDGEKLERQVDLYFEGFYFYKRKVYMNIMTADDASYGNQKKGDPSFNQVGGGFGAIYMMGKYFINASLQMTSFHRTHSITVFGKKVTEDRLYKDIHIPVKAGYSILVHPAFLALMPGLSIGYRNIEDTLITKDPNKYTKIQSPRFQAALHLDADFFPASFLGILAGLSYLPTWSVDSYDGVFNMWGEKKYVPVKVSASRWQFSIGVRYGWE